MNPDKLSADNHNGSVPQGYDSTTERSNGQHFNDELGDLGRPMELGIAHQSIPDSLEAVAGTNTHPLEFFKDVHTRPSSRIAALQDPSMLPQKSLECALPESLRSILTNGLLGSLSADTVENAEVLADLVIQAAENDAQEKKKEARARLKRNLPSLQKSVPSQLRSVYRSRIDAQVSRVKGGELNRVLKSIIRWIIENVLAQPSCNCRCDEGRGKRRKTIS